MALTAVFLGNYYQRAYMSCRDQRARSVWFLETRWSRTFLDCVLEGFLMVASTLYFEVTGVCCEFVALIRTA